MTTERRVNRITMRQISGSARSKKVRVDLGPESDFTQLPQQIKIGAANYFLIKTPEGYRMLSTLCPHQGGEVEDVGDPAFVCDTHGYEYQKTDGRCLTNPNLSLRTFLVTQQNNHLIALAPDE